MKVQEPPVTFMYQVEQYTQKLDQLCPIQSASSKSNSNGICEKLANTIYRSTSFITLES